MEKKRKIRIGTRGSPLALVQARQVASMLAATRPDVVCEIVPIKTAGDRMTKTALWEIGGKGLFVQEIERELLAGRIDIAVHSMKDMPEGCAQGLTIPVVPGREDARDVLVTPEPIAEVSQIERGAVVGTSSLRRRAQLLKVRPDLSVVSLRGNVGTRLGKLADGSCGAVIVAAAGLIRLGIGDVSTLALSPEEFVPAAGQGALALEVRVGEEEIIRALDDADARCAVFCERAFVSTLGASCHSAVGAYARVEGTRVDLAGIVLSADGRQVVGGTRSGNVDAFYEVGQVLADDLLTRGAGALISDV
jgi:hydroxymethylbilane synthase